MWVSARVILYIFKLCGFFILKKQQCSCLNSTPSVSHVFFFNLVSIKAIVCRSSSVWRLLSVGGFDKSPAFSWAAADYMLPPPLLAADESIFPELRLKKNTVWYWWRGSALQPARWLANAWVCGWLLSVELQALNEEGWCHAKAGPLHEH